MGASSTSAALPRTLRTIFAIGVALWLTFASVRGAGRAVESWPDGSHERAWTTSFEEREALMLGPIQPVLDAIEEHTDPAALILAPARTRSTELADVAANGMIGWARFIALPRMVVVVEVHRQSWRERAAEAAHDGELWVLDLTGATVGDDADLEPVASGVGWRLLSVVREVEGD